MNGRNLIWINAEWMAAETAMLPITDLSIQRGYGVFDFLKVVDGKPIFLDDHLKRFLRSAEKMHLDVGLSAAALQDILLDLINRNELVEAGIKLTLTGGASPDGYSIGKPNLIISSVPMQLNRKIVKGISLISHNHQRQLPDIKTIDYLKAIWLQDQIKAAEADDVLYHNEGKVTECPRSNFFIVTASGEVQTPLNNILQGVTRSKILEANIDGIPIREMDFGLGEVMQASEAFVTSTSKHVLPVHRIDGEKIGNGETGRITRKLSECINDMVFSKTRAI